MKDVRKVTDIYKTVLFPWLETDFVAEHDGDLILTIAGVVEGDMPTKRGDERKVVVRFKETTKALILNKTNAQTIWDLYGRLTESWLGQPIALYTERISVGGRMRDAIRIRPQQPAAESTAAAPSSAEETGPVAGDVGPNEFWTEFNAAARDGKLPNADALRKGGPIADAKRSGDWAEALRWLRGQMQF